MGLIDQVQAFFGYAETKHIDEISEQIQMGTWRQVEASFPLYSESLLNGTFIGISDRDFISENEQRTAWRGIFSACVQMRADQIATALCKAEVKRKVNEMEFEDVEDDHPWRRLWNNPSMSYDRFFLFEQISKLRDFGRGAHLAVFRGDFQVPEKLDIVYPYFGDVRVQGNTIGGIEEYVFTANGGSVEHIPKSEMIWLRHGHPVTPFESSSILARGMYESDVSLYQAIYARDIAKEGNVPNVYATSDLNITEKQAEDFGRRLTKDYRTAGKGNRKTLVLGSGTKLETIAMSPDEMQAIDAANLNNNQIFLLCGIPPEIMTEGGTLANSSEGRRKWLMNSIQPEVTKICESITHQLKVSFGAEDSDLCIVPPNVVPVDRMEQQRIREVQLRTGQRTANEFRLEDGMDEYQGGELFFIGGGIRPVQDLLQEPGEQMETTDEDTI